VLSCALRGVSLDRLQEPARVLPQQPLQTNPRIRGVATNQCTSGALSQAVSAEAGISAMPTFQVRTLPCPALRQPSLRRAGKPLPGR